VSCWLTKFVSGQIPSQEKRFGSIGEGVQSKSFADKPAIRDRDLDISLDMKKFSW
jgi:hypothetical protein